jgi:hypothetical protein
MRFEDQRLGKAFWPLALATAAILMTAPAQANGYDEGVSSDLSSNASSPTDIGALALGDNRIVGRTDPSGAQINPQGALANEDNDYLTFTVPKGDVLSKILVGDDSAFEGQDRMFLGIATGSSVSVDPSFTSASGLLGWTLVGNAAIGGDALPLLGVSAPVNFHPFPGAAGFSGPLGAGTYTLWMLDGDHDASYDLDLVVASVPETSSWVMLLAGIGLLGTALRWRAIWRPSAAM